MSIAHEALADSDPTAALQALAEAEKLDEKSPEIPFARVRAFHMRKDYERAMSEIKKFIAMQPENSDGQLTLGILLSETGRPKEAIAPMRKAAEDPLYARAQQAQTTLGIIHYRLGEIQDADRWIQRAINSNPAQACVAWYYRGHIRLKDSKLREAADAYENSTKQFCGTFGEGFLALGIVYQHLKDYERARRTYIEVEQRFPNSKIANQALERLRKLP
ncbi:MAG TPA: tetratricopeptide repeat protein [Bdellovibrionota bacterium]|nr:tetratricopeptide repeat protein [Bdellovibrionota bacterium]